MNIKSFKRMIRYHFSPLPDSKWSKQRWLTDNGCENTQQYEFLSLRTKPNSKFEKLHTKTVTTDKCANDNKTSFKLNEIENERNGEWGKNDNQNAQAQAQPQSDITCCFNIVKWTASVTVVTEQNGLH